MSSLALRDPIMYLFTLKNTAMSLLTLTVVYLSAIMSQLICAM